jgi:hypothetical protein
LSEGNSENGPSRVSRSAKQIMSQVGLWPQSNAPFVTALFNPGFRLASVQGGTKTEERLTAERLLEDVR